MTLHSVGHYFKDRLFEWAMAVSMLLLAVQTFVWPRTLEASAFHYLVLVMPSACVGVFLFLFGLARCGALIANGRSRVYGPRVRAIGCLAGAVMWAQFDLALLAAYSMKISGPPSPGIPFWFVFTFAELYSAYRAASNVRSRSV